MEITPLPGCIAGGPSGVRYGVRHACRGSPPGLEASGPCIRGGYHWEGRGGRERTAHNPIYICVCVYSQSCIHAACMHTYMQPACPCVFLHSYLNLPTWHMQRDTPPCQLRHVLHAVDSRPGGPGRAWAPHLRLCGSRRRPRPGHVHKGDHPQTLAKARNLSSPRGSGPPGT